MNLLTLNVSEEVLITLYAPPWLRRATDTMVSGDNGPNWHDLVSQSRYVTFGQFSLDLLQPHPNKTLRSERSPRIGLNFLKEFSQSIATNRTLELCTIESPIY